MKFKSILKAAVTAFAFYKANEEELKPIVKKAQKVVGRKRKTLG